jgi:ATP-dependent helicase HrpB
LAALLEERDVLQGDRGMNPADMRLRTELVQVRSGRDADVLPGIVLQGIRVDRDGVRRVRQVADDLVRRQRADMSPARQRAEASNANDDDVGSLLAMAFPDRVAQRRVGTEPRYLLRNGSGAVLSKHDALCDAPYLAVADLEGQPPEARIVRAAPLSSADIRALFANQLVREPQVTWDERTQSVRARVCTMLGALVLDESALPDPDPVMVRGLLIEQIGRAGLDALPWSTGAQRLRERLCFVRKHDDSWPNVSAEALLATLEDWAAPYLHGLRKWTQLESVDWHDALLSLCSWTQRSALDRLAPTHLEVPSGSRIAVDYSDAAAPVLAVKLQEVFGWTTTPRLMDGRVPLTLHLLSPAQRPVQVTRDLAGFWQSSYFEVRKELRGRYPRHPWPEDPLTAEPTRRAKPRGT